MLLTVPNISEGSDRAVVERLAAAWGALKLLDIHLDPDHGRSVLTMAGEQGLLSDAIVTGAGAVVGELSLEGHAGLHPHVGVLDVCPVVYPEPELEGAACAEALVVANALADHHSLPVFLYGQLAGGRERAELRRGGPLELRRRLAAAELRPDFGPAQPHPTAGATLVGARPPLVAFNLELESGTLEDAQRIAAGLRESGGGPPGVRAIGLWLSARGRAQVSFNVHDPFAVPLAELVEAVAAQAPLAAAEIVGLVPEAALAGFPESLPVTGFDRERQLLEKAVAHARAAGSGR